jgi:hypothetical protein
MAAILGLSREKVIAAVRDMYTAVATAPDRPFHFPVGREACRQVGYPGEMLDGLPAVALDSFAGVDARSGQERSAPGPPSSTSVPAREPTR